MDRPSRLRRSILSVPANRDKLVAKAFTLEADGIMLDLEDSIPVDEKEEARVRVVEIFRGRDWGRRLRAYRMNGMDTPWAYRDLIDVCEAVGDRLDVVVVPKVNDAGEIKTLDWLLGQIEARKGLGRRIGIEASIETAAGMLRVGEIAFSSPRLEALVFGIADYAASVTMPTHGISGHGEGQEEYPGHRFHFALSRMVMAAKAAGLAAIDAPYGDFQDEAGLRRSARLGAALGLDGKWAIHPNQLAVINETFTPSAADVERSQRILQAYREAQREGRGTLAIDGKMVDGASIRLAETICLQWEALVAQTRGES
jgi:citrate lyase beta subunit